MSQSIYNVIIVAALALSLTTAASVSPNMKSALKIVNSTNIRELKHNFAAEDKTGTVAYVYPVGTHPASVDELVAVPKTLPSPQKDLKLPTSEAVEKNGVTPAVVNLDRVQVTTTAAAARSMGKSNDVNSPKTTTSAPSVPNTQVNQTTASDNGKPECVTRVESSDETNKPVLVVYNSTKQEVEAMGYEVFDSVCRGDEDWDKVISAGALASLCCGSG